MEVKSEKIIAAYQSADESGKKLLEGLFPGMNLNKKDERPVIERIRTFEDAYEELKRRAKAGDNEAIALIDEWYCLGSPSADVVAFVKLRIICAALNEGWMPKFTEDETRWYPWHLLYTQKEIDRMSVKEKKELCLMQTTDYVTEYAGFAFAVSFDAPSFTDAYVGSRFCLKNSELATYCGKQFINLWADFKLLRK